MTQEMEAKFHVLWTKAVGTPDYSKKEWREFEHALQALDAEARSTVPGATFRIGERVRKHTGDYQIEGVVRGLLTTTRGYLRYVVEHDEGFLHIYAAANLQAVFGAPVATTGPAAWHPDVLPANLEPSFTQSLAAFRLAGWAVAVHNDYMLNGVPHTFWLFTKGDRCVKGEGLTDREALNEVRSRLATLAGDTKTEV